VQAEGRVVSDKAIASAERRPEPRPFQFRILHLLGLMAAICLVLAVVVQWGLEGFVVVLIVASVLSLILGYFMRRQTLRIVGGIGCVLCLFVLVFAPTIYSVNSSSPRTRCNSNMRQIVLALHLYHEIHGSFPPAHIADENGNPMHSWRVLILPYLDRIELYDEYNFDEPWDGPNNRKLHDAIVSLYRCPSADPSLPQTMTSYVAVVGPGTAWPGEKGRTLSQIKDSSPGTVLLVEVANSGIHWMEPRDLDVTQMTLTINPKWGQGISSNHGGVACVVFADGHVRFLEDDLAPETVRALLTVDDGEAHISWRHAVIRD